MAIGASSIGRYVAPITSLEFARSLYRVLGLGKSSQHVQVHPGPIGLAISGGVDSMALAALCSNIQNKVNQDIQSSDLQHLKNLRFKAFVVDHQARSGSHIEAKAVSDILSERGIASEILTIEWPKDGEPKHLSNFESAARTNRFRLLGQACRDSGINSLLLAHHEDDQVETIMMRIVEGHRSSSLRGVREACGIPECYGLHGVWESGGLDFTRSVQLQQDRPEASKPMKIESGGIRIYRPLLSYRKERLIATAKHENIEWFEDLTNQDPTLTIRNAIRSLNSNHSLPAALGPGSLIEVSKRCDEALLKEQSALDFLVDKCMVTNFNTRVGAVEVQLPSAEEIRAVSPDGSAVIATKLLRQFLTLVSPVENINITSLRGAASHIVPGVFSATTPARPHSLSPQTEPSAPKSFTAGNVLIERMTTEKTTTMSEISSTGMAEDIRKSKSMSKWRMSRQPYITSHLSAHAVILRAKEAAWTPWALYDGRYWIRIRSLLPDESWKVRPFQEHDLLRFRRSLSEADSRRLKSLLAKEARGSLRWTLPCIVSLKRMGHGRDQAIDNVGGVLEGEDGDLVESSVLALPTLNFCARNHIDWEVRYKKVDLAVL